MEPPYNLQESVHATLGFLLQTIVAHLVEPSALDVTQLESVWDALTQEETQQKTVIARMDFTRVEGLHVWHAVQIVKHAHLQQFAVHVMQLKTEDLKVDFVFARMDIFRLLMRRVTYNVKNVQVNAILALETHGRALHVILLKIRSQDMTALDD